MIGKSKITNTQKSEIVPYKRKHESSIKTQTIPYYYIPIDMKNNFRIHKNQEQISSINY